MTGSKSCPPEWRLDRDGAAATLHLSGDWIAGETGVRSAAEARRVLDDAGGVTVRVDASALRKWDSALIAFLKIARCAA